ncbi:MAG: DUF3379 family protein [Gammaproteobacteria bacterium]|nr:DUF3379 family protein [Gammaproteobacteria bacterium]
MNCQTVRHAALVDPARLPAEAQAHVGGCTSCQAFLGSLHHNDALLRKAFATTQSACLAERVLAEKGFDRSRRRFGLGLAASIALGGLGAASWLRQKPAPLSAQDWAKLMTEHFEADPEHLRPGDPEAPARFERALADLGGTRRADLPPLLRADLCHLQGHNAAHLVFEVDTRRAVVFLVGQDVGPAHFAVGDWQGELRHVVGGTVGIIAPDLATVRKLGDVLAGNLALSAVV